MSAAAALPSTLTKVLQHAETEANKSGFVFEGGSDSVLL